MKKSISLLLALVLALGCIFSLSSCKKDKNDEDNHSNQDSNKNENDNQAEETAKDYVEIDFGSYGKVIIKLNYEEAPITAKHFASLVEDGFYDGLTIFRAQRNFVIQGGKNEKVKLDPIVGEFKENGYNNNISHKRGVISMARTSDPNSATSQFFITLDDSAISSLDGKYAGFGYVVEGMDVVDKIANALMSCESDYMGFVSDEDAITIVSAKTVEYDGSIDDDTTENNKEDEKEEDKTDVMGTGACEYLETRDISGRDIKYVEMCIEGYGKLIILLDATTAPITVENFMSLVEQGFYDGLTFHRVITDFMIQGGDPSANGTGGSDKEIKGEFDSNGHTNDISHKYGVISMARSGGDETNNYGYDSASSQFFICNADASQSLDGNYAAFGYVVEGMSVIDELTKKVFPKTAYADYYGNFEIDSQFGTYKHIVWQYLGNGALNSKADQPVIKYIKVLDGWTNN